MGEVAGEEIFEIERCKFTFVDGKAGACRGPRGRAVVGPVVSAAAEATTGAGLHGEGRIGDEFSLLGCSKTLDLNGPPSVLALVGVGLKAQLDGFAKRSGVE